VSFLEQLLVGYVSLAVLVLLWTPALKRGVSLTLAILGMSLLAAYGLSGSARVEAGPIGVLAGATAVGLAIRHARRHVEASPRSSPMRRTLRIVMGGLALVAIGANAAVLEIFDPLVTGYRDLFVAEPPPVDVRGLGWSAGFEALHAQLSRAYALGAWKRIDWRALHDQFAPAVERAERTQDGPAYYLALRGYLWSLHDGHVELDGADGGLRDTALRGGFGFALLRLDDGRTVAHVLIDGGPAAHAGLRWGAEILEWNGQPIDDAVRATSLLWASSPPATSEGAHLAQQALLVRAPLGTSATVAFRNAGEGLTRTATLTSVDDRFEALARADPPIRFGLRDQNVDWRVLPEGVGYFRIRGEIPTLRDLLPAHTMRRAVAAFLASGVAGVILDVRGNVGGADKLVPRLMGFFFDRRDFYEQATFYDATTGHFEQHANQTLWTEPVLPHFGGPVVVLVDEHCVSSGEGFALAAHHLANGHVVGFHGTYGSFGMSGSEVLMPRGLTVGYPGGQSLDASGTIQIDSDWRLQGGVEPDVRVPLTLETVRAQFVEGRDVVLERAVRLIVGPKAQSTASPPYSPRNAVTGSTRVARMAGR
jgi:carboxyl-terminal processing protease